VYQWELFNGSPHKAAFESAGLPGCVTCHSNHAITKPDDQMVGGGKQAVCTNCHTEGDPGLKAADEIHAQLHELDSRIARSREILDRAAASGMEVSQAQLDLTQASDALTKARVAVHSFRAPVVAKEIAPGLAITDKTYQAGLQALHERNHRRAGLSFSLVAIGATLAGLKMVIKRIES
jgi:predicted CXXCH cytochrome family protein